MSGVTVGCIASAVFLALLSLLFRYEKKKGVRFAERARAQADFIILKISHSLLKALRYITRDFMKQVGHYLVHTLLRTILLFVTKAEKGIRNVMRVNKTLAKHAERESTTRNKLEEIALHRAKHALTEEEKKKYKDRSLKGL